MTGVTEESLMCQMFMCLFRPLCEPSNKVRRGAKGGKPQKVPRSTFLEAKGLLRRSLFL